MSDTLKAGAVALATTEGTKSWSYLDIDVSLNSTPSFGTLMSHFVNLGIDTRDARRLNTPTKILELANSGYSLWVNGAMYYFTKPNGTMDGDTTWGGGGAYYTNFDIFNIFFGIWNADGTDYIVPFAFYKYQGSNSGGLEPFRWSPLPFTFLNGDLPSADIIGTGGGATHIAKVTGLLSTLENSLSDILIVAGGGGGGLVSEGTPTAGANGGGISGSGNNSGNQSTGYAFGQGEASGGGGGLYGGYKAANGDSGGAGSGYIGNLLLDAKKMIGFNVPTSDVESTKTESVNISNPAPTANTPKAGNGFAKITWLRDLT